MPSRLIRALLTLGGLALASLGSILATCAGMALLVLQLALGTVTVFGLGGGALALAGWFFLGAPEALHGAWTLGLIGFAAFLLNVTIWHVLGSAWTWARRFALWRRRAAPGLDIAVARPRRDARFR